MFDFNPIIEIKKQRKTIKVFSPKGCLFRIQNKIGSLCKCRLKLDKNKNSEVCVCADDRWLEGCPLLNCSFILEKN